MNTIAGQNSLLNFIFQHTNDACLIVSSPEKIVLAANINAGRILGYSIDEIIGSSLDKYECALQDIFFWEELIAKPNVDTQRVIESEWLNSQGVTIPIEKRVIAVHCNEQLVWVIYAQDISQRQRIAREQLYLSAQLQSSLDATVEGIFSTDLHLNVLNINKCFIQMLNLSDDLVVSRNQATLFNYIGSLLEDLTVLNEMVACIADNNEIEIEIILKLKDLRYFSFVSKPQYLRDHLTGRVYCLRDITAMKNVERDLKSALAKTEQTAKENNRILEALKVSESRLKRLTNSSLIGICQGNESGVLTLANETLINILGVTQADIANNAIDWLSLATPECYDTYRNAFDELKTSGHFPPFNAELRHKNARNIPVLIGLAQLEGSQFEWVGFILDLSEQKKADRVKSEFIAVVSHELRTPITSIRGSLSLLEHGGLAELSDTAMRLIQIAHRNCLRLGSLVDDILDMEKLISGKMSFNLMPCDLAQLAQQALEANASYAANYHVHYQLVNKTPLTQVIADANRIMQVFANLLSNAAKFSPSNSNVDVILSATDTHLKIEVIDKGKGIPEEFKTRIFSKFSQADDPLTRNQGGTGLGLSITKSLIENMAGEIGFSSIVNAGTTFWFSLPRADK